jgi:hypothetical protein
LESAGFQRRVQRSKPCPDGERWSIEDSERKIFETVSENGTLIPRRFKVVERTWIVLVVVIVVGPVDVILVLLMVLFAVVVVFEVGWVVTC